MNHIDVSSVLRRTVSCELFSNLVTRPTGAAVRKQIESLVADSHERSLTVIDFSHVGMIDFSCADEVVAKLLLHYNAAEQQDQEAYFVFRGVNDDHWDAIETVLERHRLALVLEGDDGCHVVGTMEDDDRLVWEKVLEVGRATPAELASALDAVPDMIQAVCASLHRRGLLMRLNDAYVAVGGMGEHA